MAKFGPGNHRAITALVAASLGLNQAPAPQSVQNLSNISVNRNQAAPEFSGSKSPHSIPSINVQNISYGETKAVLDGGQSGGNSKKSKQPRTNDKIGRSESDGHRKASRSRKTGNADRKHSIVEELNLREEPEVIPKGKNKRIAGIDPSHRASVAEISNPAPTEYSSASERRIAKKALEKKRDLGRKTGRIRKEQNGLYELADPMHEHESVPTPTAEAVESNAAEGLAGLNRHERRAAAAAARAAEEHAEVLKTTGDKPVFALAENDLPGVVGAQNVTPEIIEVNKAFENPGALNPVVQKPIGRPGGGGGSSFREYSGGVASKIEKPVEEKLAFFAKLADTIKTSFAGSTPTGKFVKGAGGALGAGLLIHGISNVFSSPAVDPKTGVAEESGWTGRITGLAEGAIGLTAAYFALTRGGKSK